MAIKRRLSTLGSIGPLIEIMMGLRGLKVIFRTFGRICPIEAPESSKIDLISSLRAYALNYEMIFRKRPPAQRFCGIKPLLYDLLEAPFRFFWQRLSHGSQACKRGHLLIIKMPQDQPVPVNSFCWKRHQAS